MTLTILIVWLQGLHLERSLLRNTELSTVILSGFLFLFMTIGLYRGYKLKDTLGKITDRFKTDSEGLPSDWMPDLDGLGEADGCEGIFAWVLASIAIGILIFFFSTVLWFSIVFLIAILYWIYYRGLRYVFKKSPICQGNLVESIKYAGIYTLCASLWLMIILFILENQNYSVLALGDLF